MASKETVSGMRSSPTKDSPTVINSHSRPPRTESYWADKSMGSVGFDPQDPFSPIKVVQISDDTGYFV